MGGATTLLLLSGGGGAPPPPPAYPGLVEALAAFLRADPVVSAFFAGGVANDRGDRDAAYPFVTFSKTETRPRKTWKPGCQVDRVTVHFCCTAAGAGDAEESARVLKSRLLASASYAPAALSFADGAEPSPLSRYVPEAAGGESTMIGPARGYGNADVFESTVPIVFVVARG